MLGIHGVDGRGADIGSRPDRFAFMIPSMVLTISYVNHHVIHNVTNDASWGDQVRMMAREWLHN